jgi:hypothetical protein
MAKKIKNEFQKLGISKILAVKHFNNWKLTYQNQLVIF